MPEFLNLEDIFNHTVPPNLGKQSIWDKHILTSANPEPVELAFVAFVALAALAQSRSNLTIQSTFTIRKKTSHISKNPLKNLPGEF